MIIVYYWKAAVWFIIVIILSILSSDKLPDVQMNFEHTDKIAHFIMYFIFSYFILEGHLQSRKGSKRTAILIAFLLPFAVGFATEMMQQSLTLTREGDPYDFFANTLGILIGILLFRYIYRFQLLIISKCKQLVSTI